MKKKIISLALASIMCFTAVMGNYVVSNADDDASNSTTTGGGADETNEGVSISKTVTYAQDETTGDYSYTLNLESFTTGEVTQVVETATPTDIVLVLDQSTSMIWPLSGEEDGKTDIGIYDYDDDGNLIEDAELIVGDNTTYTEDNAYLYSESRQKILIDAVTDFIESVKESAENNGVSHRISIVTFNNGVATEYGLTTEYDDLIAEVDAWATADNTEDEYDGKTTDYRYTFNLDHSTQIYLGVKEAEDTLTTALSTDSYGDYATDERQQVAVVFTDGEPTNTDSSTYKYPMYNVNYTIDSALNMKGAGVDVFTIGLFSEADSNADTDIVVDGTAVTSANSYGDTNVAIDWATALNRFLDLTSSNYLTASSFGSNNSTSTDYWPDEEGTVTITSNFDRQATTEYYYGLSSSDTGVVTTQLANIFTTISSGLSSNSTILLDETTQVRDIMTNDFSIPKDASNLTVSIVYADGVDQSADEQYDEYDSEYYLWNENIEVIYANGAPVTGWDNIKVTLEDVVVDTVAKDADGNIIYDTDGNPTYTGVTYSTQQVIVEGFDYNAYYVTADARYGDYTGDVTDDNATTTEFYGAKLVISFDIEPNSEVIDLDDANQEIDEDGYYTFGGNAIDTNHVTSGIYIYDEYEESYSSLESFPVPTADIDINLDFSTSDQTIYLGNSISVTELLEIDGHTIMGVANKYVDIEFNVYNAADVNEDGEINSDAVSLLKVTIPAGTSVYDSIDGTYDVNSLITPTEMSSYVISIEVTPINTGSIEVLETISDPFNVYVLYPTVDANDIWVDYATPVNLREDNIIQVIDDSGSYSTYDAIRVSWETYDTDESGDSIDIPEPNNAIPPTVTFGFTARRGIEYTAAEFEEYGVREDKEFTITTMTISSSDGYSNVSVYDMDDYVADEDAVTFEVNINRFDLEISKTVEADVYDAYPQSFIFDIEYTGSEFVTETGVATGPNGFAIFARESNSNSTVKLYVDTDGYEDGTGAYTIWTNMPPTDSDYVKDETTGYYNITELFFDDGENANTSEDYIDLETFTIYYASAPTDSDDDAFVATYSIDTVAINDIEKNIEVVVDPDMSNVETVEWTDDDDTRYYTFTTTITDLYCGIDMTVTEETDWSWRYEPGFTTSTTTEYAAANNLNLTYISSTDEGTSDSDENGSYTTYTNKYTDTNSVMYTVANKVYTSGTLKDTVITTISDSEGNVLQSSTSTMSVDGDGDITQETREEVNTYRMLQFDEVHNTEDYSNDTVEESSSALGQYEGDLDVDYDYYLTDMTFDSVSYVTTSGDGSEATILVLNSEDYLDKNDSTVYSDWERITNLSYLGGELYTASDVSFTSNSITYTSSEHSSSAGAEVKITTALESDSNSDQYDVYGVYYYGDDGNPVYGIQIENVAGEDQLTPATYYYIIYEEMTDSDGNVVVDTEGNSVYTETEAYAFQVLELAEPVPAYEFETIDVSLDVFNTLVEDQWLSDSSLIENFYSLYSDSSDSTDSESD